jgi:hypothetical protein
MAHAKRSTKSSHRGKAASKRKRSTAKKRRSTRSKRLILTKKTILLRTTHGMKKYHVAWKPVSSNRSRDIRILLKPAEYKLALCKRARARK